MAPADAPRRRMLPLVVAVAVATVAWVTGNVVWLVHHRSGQPLNIDEAGYLGISLNYAFGWERGGLPGWLESIFYPSIQAPLTTATTSLVQLSGWDHRAVAFGVVLAFAVVTIAATTALAATVGGRTAVVVSVMMLLSAPGFVALSRNFVFAVPAAAVTMLALYALRRSRWLTSTAWSAAFGVAVGLMPLARTMMISFAPVLLFVAVVHALGHRAPRRRQALNAVLAGVLSVVVAATWLLPSARLVFGYLTEYGYGKHSAEYAGSAALPPVRVLAAFGQDFFAPHLLLIAVGWLLLVVPGRWRRDGRSFVTVLQDVAASPVFPCIGLVLGASAALMTSDNGGFGFTLPLLAPAIVAAAAGWTRALGALSAPAVRRAGVAALGLVCLVLMIPSFDGSSWLARQRSVNVLGASVNVTNGLHTDPAYVFGRTYTRTTDPDKLRNSPRWGADWERAAVRLVGEVLDGSTKRPEYAFGFRDRYMNVNTVQLKVVEKLHYGVFTTQVDPTEYGRSRADYRDWLTRGPAGTVCQLLLADGTANEFTPLPLVANLRAAARGVGFRPDDSVGLPDGRTVTVWERSGDGC